MRIESVIARSLGIVDKALRKEFPEDFDKRCLYAAFATSALLQDAGVQANLVGGDFLAFVVSRVGKRAGLQGFGGATGGQPSHFWVEVEDTIVDPGPHYLPKGSSFAAASMPLVSWKRTGALPPYLRYRAHISYDPAVQLHSEPSIMRRKDVFVAHCREKFRAQLGQPKLPAWVLSGPEALARAAQAGTRGRAMRCGLRRAFASPTFRFECLAPAGPRARGRSDPILAR
jgi:hypothetical protein